MAPVKLVPAPTSESEEMIEKLSSWPRPQMAVRAQQHANLVLGLFQHSLIDRAARVAHTACANRRS